VQGHWRAGEHLAGPRITPCITWRTSRRALAAAGVLRPAENDFPLRVWACIDEHIEVAQALAGDRAGGPLPSAARSHRRALGSLTAWMSSLTPGTDTVGVTVHAGGTKERFQSHRRRLDCRHHAIGDVHRAVLTLSQRPASCGGYAEVAGSSTPNTSIRTTPRLGERRRRVDAAHPLHLRRQTHVNFLASAGARKTPALNRQTNEP